MQQKYVAHRDYTSRQMKIVYINKYMANLLNVVTQLVTKSDICSTVSLTVLHIQHIYAPIN